MGDYLYAASTTGDMMAVRKKNRTQAGAPSPRREIWQHMRADEQGNERCFAFVRCLIRDLKLGR